MFWMIYRCLFWRCYWQLFIKRYTKSNRISLTKNIALPEQNIETTIVATKFENGNGKNTTCVWPEHGYFKQQPCDFHIDKENYPENSILYINQGNLTIKDNKKLYYADHYILGQVTECFWWRPCWLLKRSFCLMWFLIHCLFVFMIIF